MLTESHTELDALGLDDEPIAEGETPSYLQDATALPDFVDSAPVEENHVSGPSARAEQAIDRLSIADLCLQNAPTAEVAR
jgi:hypothetical protein